MVDGRVVVDWETASEVGTAGFNLERWDEGTGQWIRVNPRMVPALFESVAGGSYSVVDDGAQPYAQLTYRLVEVETSGTLRTYGPYATAAQIGLPSSVASSEISSGWQTVRIPKIAMLATSPPSRPPLQSVVFEPGAADRLRIEVTASGLYRLSSADIAAGLGLSDAGARELIRTKGLSLSTRGFGVAYLQAADNSALYFYGQALQSIYASSNVYWLAPGIGRTMTAAANLTTKAAVKTSFVDRVHFEQDLLDATLFFHDPEGDFWLWDYLVAGDPSLGTKTFTVNAPDALKGTQLAVLLQGFSTTGKATSTTCRSC